MPGIILGFLTLTIAAISWIALTTVLTAWERIVLTAVAAILTASGALLIRYGMESHRRVNS